jgi:hypothetical protein
LRTRSPRFHSFSRRIAPEPQKYTGRVRAAPAGPASSKREPTIRPFGVNSCSRLFPVLPTAMSRLFGLSEEQWADRARFADPSIRLDRVLRNAWKGDSSGSRARRSSAQHWCRQKLARRTHRPLTFYVGGPAVRNSLVFFARPARGGIVGDGLTQRSPATT